MKNDARLVEVSEPNAPDAAVVVLHGGASRRANMRVSPTQLSVVRMIPFAHGLAGIDRKRLAVYRLLNSVRGWDSKHTPVQDVRWALDEVENRLGRRVPVALVGHSLGGRAALLAADHPAVRSAAALAPWVYPHEPVHATGRSILVVHGSNDRVANPANAAMLVGSLADRNRAGFVLVCGAKHAMLRSRGTFFRLTRDFVAATLLDREITGPAREVLDGATWIEV